MFPSFQQEKRIKRQDTNSQSRVRSLFFIYDELLSAPGCRYFIKKKSVGVQGAEQWGGGCE